MSKPRLQVQIMKTSDLIPYARNAKQHPEEQVAQIAASIREFGMNDPVAVWHDKDGTPVIVEGHGRVLALQKLNIEECPVICLDDLTDSQRKAYTLIHNKLTMNSGFDTQLLNVELDDLAAEFDMQEFGFNTFKDLDELFDSQQPDETPTEPAHQSKTVVCPECGHEFNINE